MLKSIWILVFAALFCLSSYYCAEPYWKGQEDVCFVNIGFYPSPKCRVKCLKEKHYVAACDNLGRCFCLKKTVKPISLED